MNSVQTISQLLHVTSCIGESRLSVFQKFSAATGGRTNYGASRRSGLKWRQGKWLGPLTGENKALKPAVYVRCRIGEK